MSEGKAGETPRTVLIADDDPQILAMVSLRLSNAGYRVLQARDGSEALNVARHELPDVVVLDVMMPHVNGWEVAKALRGDASLANTAIVMLTAIGERINELTSPLQGADEYVDKPFEFKELEDKIESALKRRQTP
jgi:DNA-binding response OmpR family regulator